MNCDEKKAKYTLWQINYGSRKNAKTHCSEEDINEVVRSDIVYSNASKRTPAKSKDLVVAFQTDDLSKICIEVCEVEPSFFRDCDALVRSLYGRSEILAEKDTNDDDCDD
ncbi:hypothetical protein C5167_004185 [Papaver somniferum]|nr:hypothetical protein C5167_004185 [Papaver somniferum]